MEGKRNGFAGHACFAFVSYIVISIIVAFFSGMRQSFQKNDGAGISVWVVLLFFIVPLLFFLAGYLGTTKFGFEKLKVHRVLLWSTVFSAVLLGLWYVLLELYALCNLPAAEGSYLPDLWLRKTIVTYGYEYRYLQETDLYRYVILPLIHFVFRIIYWLFYMWGNRICVSGRNKRKSS